MSSKRFLQQVAIVTGGAQGIGRAIAARLAKEGATVAIVDRQRDHLQAFEASIRPDLQPSADVLTIESDVTQPEQVQSSVERVMQKYGRIDVLVTAAGITGKTNLKTHEVQLDDFQRVFRVNVDGIFLYCRAVLPFMLQHNYGRIVNIASISGKEGNAGMLAYSSSKAAVIGLTKVIGKEYAENGITCNAIAPAVIRTAMVDALPPDQVRYMTDKIPMKRTGELDEIAALASYIASKEASFTTAFTYDLSGGRATY